MAQWLIKCILLFQKTRVGFPALRRCTTVCNPSSSPGSDALSGLSEYLQANSQTHRHTDTHTHTQNIK